MWQIAGDENFHFAYMWQVVTGKATSGVHIPQLEGITPPTICHI